MSNIIVIWFALFAVISCSVAAQSSIVSRSSWGARSPTHQRSGFMEMPSSVILYHSGTPNCYTMEKCKIEIYNLQANDMTTLHLADIRANFLIGGDGNVYEGRGWGFASVHTSGYQSASIEICIVGNYDEIKPRKIALNALKNLLEYGVENAMINPTYKLYLQRETRELYGAPKKLQEIMKSWSHVQRSPNIITKQMWSTNYLPLIRPSNIPKISTAVLISYVETSSCNTMKTCTELFTKVMIRNLKEWSLENSVYSNFLVGEDGSIYEDAGWSNKNLYNGTSIQITLIGNFTDRSVNSVTLNAVKNLLAHGVAMGILSPYFELYEHMDHSMNFRLPDKIRDIVITWPNWQEKPYIIQKSKRNVELIPQGENDFSESSSMVLIHHLNNSNCTTLNTCVTIIDNNQKLFKNQSSWKNIPCNFIINNTGNIYEGTGWYGTKLQDPIYAETFKICVIAVIENHKKAIVITREIEKLLDYGTAIAMINLNYNLNGFQHPDKNSSSYYLYDTIKYSSHWQGIPNIIMRNEWNARKPIKALPIKEISTLIIIFNAADASCDNFNDCTRAIKDLQDHQMNVYKMSDISFNFLIGGDNNVYEGRGWNFEGHYSIEYNRSIVEICIMGNFDDEMPNSGTIDNIHHLLRFGEKIGKISPSYTIFERRDYPYYLGTKLKTVVHAMPHFLNTPEIVSRSMWGAVESNETRETYEEIPTAVFIARHSLPICFTPAACRSTVKQIQTLDMNLNMMSDISYNFLIGGDGFIYMGRGWSIRGPYSNVFQNKSIEIGIIGNSHDVELRSRILIKLNNLLKFGIKMGNLNPNYILYNSPLSSAQSNSYMNEFEPINIWHHTQEIPTIIERSQWNATEPKEKQTHFLNPPKFVIVTGSRALSCFNKDDCNEIVKFIQAYHMMDGSMNDIKYNFLIGTDGNVYEGLGWKVQGKLQNNYPSPALQIFILGRFAETDSITVKTAMNLLGYGVATGKLDPFYAITYSSLLINNRTLELSIIQRSMWNARKPKRETINFTKIPTSVVIYHSATAGCNTTESCQNSVQNLQNYSMNVNNWRDIGYNFVIAEDGNVYEGLGWDAMSIELSGRNSTSLEICIIGIDEYKEPNITAIDAVKNLLNYGVANNKINPKYALHLNRFATSFFHPANQLHNVFVKWPHWQESVKIIPRSVWSNIPMRIQATNFSEIPKSVIIFHSKTKNCLTERDCIKIVQDLENATSGIGYNFLIGEDGNIFEGRGWNVTGFYSGTFALQTIEIFLIGNFTEQKPLAIAIEAIGNLLEYGVRMKLLSKELNLYEYRRGTSILDRSNKLFESIGQWSFLEPSPMIYDRTIWALRYLQQSENIFVKIPNAIVVRQTNTSRCFTIDNCITVIRNFQRQAMIYFEREEIYAKTAPRFDDIIIMNSILCHFMIGEDGNVYEGLGWNVVGGNDRDRYRRDLEICIIGNFTNEAPKSAAMNAFHELLNFGVGLGKLNSTYALYRSPMITSDSIGATKLIELLKLSSHWKESPIINNNWKISTPFTFRGRYFLGLPTSVIVSYHNGPSCSTRNVCSNFFSTYLIKITAGGTKSNFLISEDGDVYENSGWSRKSFNESPSIIINVYSNFTNRERNYIIIKTIRNLLEFGVATGKIVPNYHLYEGESPGNDLEFTKDILKTTVHKWPNWRAIPKIISRSEWDGGSIRSKLRVLLHLATRVIVYQMLVPNCTNVDKCKTSIKNLEDHGDNLPYHFLIDESGNIYEGYEWFDIMEARNLYNEVILKICVIGNFYDDSKFPKIISAMENLVDFGIAMGKINTNYVLYGVRHPNVNKKYADMYEAVKKLPHWRSHPNIIMRSAWDKRYSLEPVYTSTAAIAVIITHFSRPHCTKMEDCLDLVTYLQDTINEKGNVDFAYNFLIGGDGNVYETHGYEVWGKYALLYNKPILQIMGNFNSNESNSNASEAIANLIQYGLSTGKINSQYKLYSYQKSYSDPGIKLSNIIGALAQWKEIPPYLEKPTWNAREPKKPATKLTTVPRIVFLSHSSTSRCFISDDCKKIIRDIQDHQMNELNLTDIGYNFLIGEDGTVYEGLGWDSQPLLSNESQERSIIICFIGNFQNNTPKSSAIYALNEFLDFGELINKLESSYILYEYDEKGTHLQRATMLYDAMLPLSHWQSIPKIITRSEWNATEIEVTGSIVPVPPAKVVVGTTVKDGCGSMDECKQRMKNLQNDHITLKGWKDVDSNFFIDENGNIYEGRGWHVQGYHPTLPMDKYLLIRVFGSYAYRYPSPDVAKAIKALLAHAVITNKINTTYNLYAEPQLLNNDMKWNELHYMISRLPQWANNH